MRCPACGAENPTGAKFCDHCRAAFAAACPGCGRPNRPGARFCNECGVPLAGAAEVGAPPQPPPAAPETYTPRHLAEKILASRSALEGERKQVTVLFADVVGSTELVRDRDPEDAQRLLDGAVQRMMRAVHRYEGTVNHILGDGIMALFGAPVAHEDHAVRACYAALAMQEATRRYTEEARRKHGVPIQLRVGLNSGEVVVRAIANDLRMDYSAIGQTVHLAARMEQLATPDSTLLGPETLRLAEGYVEVRRLEPVPVKGLPEPVEVFELLGTGRARARLQAAAMRGLTRFVGRERELAVINDFLAQARRGRGQVVDLVAEPGMGKSRLLYEFARRLGADQAAYVEARCLSYGSTIPYLPVLDIVRGILNVNEADGPERAVATVVASLQGLGMRPDAAGPCLLVLLGIRDATGRLAALSSEAIKARTFDTLTEVLLESSRRRPLVLAVEDLHWTDGVSEEYLARLVDNLAGARILLLCTYRPGYRPPWTERWDAAQITLGPLGQRDSLRVVQSVSRAEGLSDALAGRILARAEGNPFFLEELARAVREHGDLRAETAVPETVQGVLAARIDRLPDESKRVLQTASVLGREFPLRLLRAIWDGPSLPDLSLLELARQQFLHERVGAEEPTYLFKHALTQDVAYESLLTTRRASLHGAAGRAIEALYAERLPEVYDRLAYHYARSEDAEKAVEYLTRFGDRAARSYAHAEAAAAYSEALARVERLPPEQREPRCIDILLRQAHSLFLLGRLPELVELYGRQRDRLERLGDSALAGPYHFWLAHSYAILGDRDGAARHASRAIEEANRCGDNATLGKAHYVLSVEDFWLSRPRKGVEHGRRAIDLLEHTDEQYWLGMAFWAVGMHHAFLGEFESAVESESCARRIGSSIGNPRLQCYAAWTTGWVQATRGDWGAGIQACEQSIVHARDPYTRAVALGILGYALLQRGDVARSISALQESVRDFGEFGVHQVQGWIAGYLSEAYLLDGRREEARDLAARVAEMAERLGFRFGAASARRVLGRCARASDALAEAEDLLIRALRAFDAISAAFEVGRTHLELAELADARGDGRAAMSHVAQARHIFAASDVPRYMERTKRLAKRLRGKLPEQAVG
jgi:class 3 adenylate cyclase/tetratricopeptide (TPR) repeat protein